MGDWSDWAPFPDPRQQQFLCAPIGPGVYELRRRDSGKWVLVGSGKNVAYRMTSLVPAPLGQGTRRNDQKRRYVLENLSELEYRCCPCATEADAQALETRRKSEVTYLYPT